MKPVGACDTEVLVSMARNTKNEEDMVESHNWLVNAGMYGPVPPALLHDARMSLLPSEFEKVVADGFYSSHHRDSPILGVVRVFSIPEVFKTPPRARVINWTFTINAWEAGKPTFKLSTQADVRRSVYDGDYAFSIDGKAAFNQFAYGEKVKNYVCTSYKGQWYHLNRLAMGQRQAVKISDTAIRVLAEPCKTTHYSYVDGLKHAGSVEDLTSDLRLLDQRSKLVHYTWNEDLTRPAELISEVVEFVGLVLNHRTKQVKLTQKVLKKIVANWEKRTSWSVRSFIVHVCLLFYCTLATARPPGKWQRVLQVWAHLQGVTCRDPEPLTRDVAIDNALWPFIEDWTITILENEWIEVPRQEDLSDFVIITDASGFGWAGVVICRKTGQSTVYAEQWPQALRSLAASSSIAEPLGLVATVNSFFLPTVRATALYLGDNKGFTHTVEKGYSTSESQVAMEYLASSFPGLRLKAEHTPGATIPMDAPSRGLPLNQTDFRAFCELRGLDISNIRELYENKPSMPNALCIG
jgi:hypothetical protein